MKQLLKEEMKRNSAVSAQIRTYLITNSDLPEAIINHLLQERLQRPDCLMNGWVLEGFPQNLTQVNLLSAMRINPNLVVQLDISFVDAA